MADVTIGNLPPGIALGQCFVPLSDTIATVKARVSALQVDYSNITSKPTIPDAQVNSDWNATSGVEQILNKPSTFNGINGMQLFTTSGTFNVPSSITKIEIHAIGGGGGAGSSVGGNNDAKNGNMSTVIGTGISAYGGGASRGSNTSTGGSTTGNNIILSSVGNAGVTGTSGGAEGLRLYGVGKYGGGGNPTNPLLGTPVGGGSGGYGVGTFAVTPGGSLSVVVGTGGAQGTYNTTGVGNPGSSGAVLIKW